MKNNAIRYHHLSSQIVWRFCIFTVLLSSIYGLIAFILMYTLEDSFIEKGIKQEATYLTTNYEKTGYWPTPRAENITLHFSKNTFPDEIRLKAIEEPRRREFYGQKERHYHVMALESHQNTYLVAEVGADLLVRPIREGVIKFLVVSGLTVTVIACLIAWLIGRKMAKPLRKLAELVDGVAPENVPEKFAEQFPKNEIGILADTLELAFVSISQAIDRERCFTRDVSHELRTPLAVIKNAVEVYRSKDSNESVSNEVINRIGEAAEQMEKTVTTLLMLAREEHNTSEKTAVALMPLIEQSVIAHSQLLDGKEVEVVISDNCVTNIQGQAGMLKVLLDNLISNAFQYTVEGEVAIDFDAGALIVRDTGPGIETKIADNITKPAVKGSKSTGYGFGLAIVNRLCEHQGWQLEVTSEQGTSIRVMLVEK